MSRKIISHQWHKPNVTLMSPKMFLRIAGRGDVLPRAHSITVPSTNTDVGGFHCEIQHSELVTGRSN